MRFLDCPLRNDDARLGHYVAMMTALDELWQALVNAVHANDNSASDEPSGGLPPDQATGVRKAAAHVPGSSFEGLSPSGLGRLLPRSDPVAVVVVPRRHL